MLIDLGLRYKPIRVKEKEPEMHMTTPVNRAAPEQKPAYVFKESEKPATCSLPHVTNEMLAILRDPSLPDAKKVKLLTVWME